MSKEILKHVDESIMDLGGIELQKFVDVQLSEASDQLVGILRVLLEDKRQVIDHLPDKHRCVERIEQIHQFWADNLERFQII